MDGLRNKCQTYYVKAESEVLVEWGGVHVDWDADSGFFNHIHYHLPMTKLFASKQEKKIDNDIGSGSASAACDKI